METNSISKKLNKKEYDKEYRKLNSERRKELNRTHYSNNQEHYAQRSKIWRLENPLKTRNYTLKHRHRITLDHYNIMLMNQNNKCKICRKEEIVIDSRTKQPKRLSVDHNHKTGKIRGLLCDRCNLSLGRLDEDIEIMKNMINYKLTEGDIP